MIKLRQEQVIPAKQLLDKKKAILFADCAFGKTYVASHNLALLKDHFALVVCPASVVAKWRGVLKESGRSEKDTFVISYNSLIKHRNYIFDMRKSCEKAVLVVDEAHRVSNFAKVQSAEVLKYAKKCDSVYFLTATPLQNKPDGAYWPLKICGEHSWDLQTFRERFCGRVFNHRVRRFIDTGPTRKEEFKQMLDRASIKPEPCEKPLKVEKNIIDAGPCEPFPRKKIFKASEWRHYVGDLKLDVFKSLWAGDSLDYLKKTKVVFFTHHREITLKLAEFLHCEYILGGMSINKKTEVINRFEAAKYGCLVASIEAAGEGIDINNCDRCFFLEITYSPSKDKQAMLRIGRELSCDKIYVDAFLCKDEYTHLVQSRKKGFFNYLGIV